MISLLFHILLLFQCIRAIDTGNCNKLWGMSNTINNINLYSADLYICESHIGEKIKESNIKSPSSSKNNNLNELNSFLSKTFNISTNETELFNKSNVFLNNNTKLNNITYQSSYNISTTNISTTSNTSQLYGIFSPSSYIPSPSIYSPSPINTPSPSSNLNIFSPSISLENISPSDIIEPSSLNNLDEQKTISNLENVDRFNETERKENNNDNLTLEPQNNTFIVITIILSSILLILLIAFIVNFFVKKKTCNLSLKTVPEEKKEEVDLEIGEKNKKISNKYTETSIKKNSKTAQKNKPLSVQKPLTIQQPSISSAVPIIKQKSNLKGGRGKNAIRKTKLNLKTIKQFGQRKNDNIDSPAIKKVVNKNVTMYNMKSETQEKLKAIEKKKNNQNITNKPNDENEII